MSQEGFSWKSLFINEENKETNSEQSIRPIEHSTHSESSKFPENIGGQFQETSSNSYIAEVLAVYESGFNSLNQSDFDFFEMYKSVMAVGISNPQSYQMAFAMGKSIKSDLTKSFLLEKAKFYIDEIEKVYIHYDITGRKKNEDLKDLVNKDKTNLSKSISNLESQIVQLQKELEQKKAELQGIDAKTKDQFKELQMKMEANNYAKHKILDSINQVVTGINQYL